MLLADSMVIVPSTRSSGVTGWNGAETETRDAVAGQARIVVGGDAR